MTKDQPHNDSNNAIITTAVSASAAKTVAKLLESLGLLYLGIDNSQNQRRTPSPSLWRNNVNNNIMINIRTALDDERITIEDSRTRR